MIACLSCGATTTNGLALCDLCRRKVSADLEFLPIYFRNLARWRPGRAGTRTVPGSREPVRLTSGDDRVSRTLDEAGNALTTWVRQLTEARPQLLAIRPHEAIFADLTGVDLTEAETTTWICRGFERWLTSIATLDWCGQFVTDIGDHEAKLRGLTETAAPGWYGGACRHCQAATFVVPGITWVKCRACGSTTYARDHLETVLDEARGWVARPKRIAEALVALVDTEPSVPRLHDRIRQWEHRDRLTAVRKVDADGDEVGPKRYRMGEVLDLLSTEGDTRSGTVGAKAS